MFFDDILFFFHDISDDTLNISLVSPVSQSAVRGILPALKLTRNYPRRFWLRTER